MKRAAVKKIEQAATFALVGWYLMMPAPARETFMEVSPPIGRWDRLGTYDTEKDCNQASDEMNRKSEREGFQMKGFNPEDVRRSWALAQCISTDDPRLKEK